MAAAQGPDGYLNTYFTFERESERWTNLRDMHELYCAGHLIQAAVAHHRATGKTDMLRVACSVAGHICTVCRPAFFVDVRGRGTVVRGLGGWVVGWLGSWVVGGCNRE